MDKSFYCVVAMLVCQFSMATLAAQSVTAIALFNDKAMLSVNGSKAKVIAAGNSYKGVTLISSNTDEAIVSINGQQQSLRLNGTVLLDSSLASQSDDVAGPAKVAIFVDQSGSFFKSGRINGRSLTFLVDTGASLVVLNSVQADRLGLRYRDGVRTLASTASGNAPMYTLNADTVSVGNIELSDVRVGVIEGQFPEVPLLGMTFLSQVDMTRKGNLMVLEKR